MANLDIHFTHSVNGVAKLHTEILKNSELAPFYAIYPEKFNNKTNGITFRRWLMSCNPALAARIDDAIGAGWRRDSAELEKLLAHIDDAALLTSSPRSSGPTSGASPIGCGGTRVPSSTRTACSMCSRSASTSTSASS